MALKVLSLNFLHDQVQVNLLLCIINQVGITCEKMSTISLATHREATGSPLDYTSEV